MDYRFVKTQINITNSHKEATEEMYNVDLLIIWICFL
jgi:hypothetical protein